MRCLPTFLFVAAALPLCACQQGDPWGNFATPTTTTATTTIPTTTTSLSTSLPGRLGSFMVLGDWGYNPNLDDNEIQSRGCQQAVADAMAQTASVLGDLKFIVNVGDSFYGGGVRNKSDPTWDSMWRDVYSAELRSVPWYSVYGNHDIWKDPYACSADNEDAAQVNSDTSDRHFFYMPNTSYYVEHEELKLEVIALDFNNYWVDHTCHKSPCDKECRDNVRQRTEDGFKLFWERTSESQAENLVIFSHYPTDYFWDYPELLDELRRNDTHRIFYFGGHRHNVDRESTTSIWPNDSWLSGGGGGRHCEWYDNKQGFVVGEIGADGEISTYPVIIDFDLCCPRSW